MRCPSTNTLTKTFRDLTADKAKLIRKLAKAVDDKEALRALVECSCPSTLAYVQRMHSDPYASQMWRVTVALHAIDAALGTHGVEALGPGRSGDRAPPYEYCNAGDPYVATLIYKRDTDNLFIGCWGDIAEKHPSW